MDPFEGDPVTAPAASHGDGPVGGGHAASDPADSPDQPAPRGPAGPPDPTDPGPRIPRYIGRRRQPSEGHALPADATSDGDHTPVPAEPAGRRRARDDAQEPTSRPGRRRRDEDGSAGGHARSAGLSDDVLARLLGR